LHEGYVVEQSCQLPELNHLSRRGNSCRRLPPVRGKIILKRRIGLNEYQAVGRREKGNEFPDVVTQADSKDDDDIAGTEFLQGGPALGFLLGVIGAV